MFGGEEKIGSSMYDGMCLGRIGEAIKGLGTWKGVRSEKDRERRWIGEEDEL